MFTAGRLHLRLPRPSSSLAPLGSRPSHLAAVLLAMQVHWRLLAPLSSSPRATPCSFGPGSPPTVLSMRPARSALVSAAGRAQTYPVLRLHSCRCYCRLAGFVQPLLTGSFHGDFGVPTPPLSSWVIWGQTFKLRLNVLIRKRNLKTSSISFNLYTFYRKIFISPFVNQMQQAVPLSVDLQGVKRKLKCEVTAPNMTHVCFPA